MVSQICYCPDLGRRLANRVQITSDGHHAYLQAVDQAFGWSVDYAMLIEIYGSGGGQPETRYSPGVDAGSASSRQVQRRPDDGAGRADAERADPALAVPVQDERGCRRPASRRATTCSG